MRNDTRLQELYSLIGEKHAQWAELSKAIWDHPETAYREVFACEQQVKLLRELGFQVTTPYCGIETAYRADYGEGTPAFAWVAEYDALPKLGHGCGHNLICTAAVAAAYAAKTLFEKHGLPGHIVLLGTPAEESGGGKVKMLEKNGLDGIDAAMMVHPSWRTTPDTGSTAIRRFDVEFFGKAAHAAGAPELGLNALDAVLLLFNAMNAWRQQLPETARLHGIIVNGGEAPNIVPDYAKCRFYLRSTDETWIEKMERRFHDMIRGAELMTGTGSKTSQFNVPYMSRKPNSEMNQVYIGAAKELGLNPVIPKRAGRGSSDFGDFSHKVPGIHPYFGIADHEIAAHSTDFAEAAGTEYGLNQALKAAAAMAETGVRFLTDEEFRRKVKTEFEAEKCQNG